MPNTRDLLIAPKLKVLVSSPPGKGKTTLAGTFTSAGPMYFFNFDRRIEVLSGLDIDYDDYDCTSSTSFDKALKKLAEIEQAGYYAAVCLDGLTTFSQAAMTKAMPLVKAIMPRLQRIGDGGIEVPADSDFNAQMTYIESFIRRMTARLNCHVIVTAHEKAEKKEQPGQTTSGRKELFLTGNTQIAVTGQLSDRIPGYFNELWRIEVEHRADASGQRGLAFKLQTRPTPNTSARTAYPDALAMWEVPDFKVLYEKITKHLATKAPAAASQPKPAVNA